MENDVCVIKLNQPVPSNIKPVTLNFRKKPGKSTVPGTLSPARVKSNQAVGVQATAVGFGDTKNEGTSSDRLLQAKMPIIPVKSCMEEFDMPTPDSVLCVANKKADTCQGDSGGPLLKGDIQIGITSYGGDCLDGTGGVYTKVSYYQDWIASVVKRST
jgi:secreted trypsin-like serine protease